MSEPHFEWDPEKERRNLAKHGLDFSWARLVFADPGLALVHDRFEAGEDRWHAIGAVTGGLRVLLVVHCTPDEDSPERVRIISLRKATARERQLYHDDHH